MNLELPNKIKPNYLTQYSNKEKVLINLYDKISNKLNNDELELIIHELDFKFQKDWLLRFELLSLLDPIEHSKLIDKIKIQIHEISKDNHDLNNSIERGLNIIY